MNFDTSVRGCVTTTLDRFDVGNVYRDDAEKLHSDLIGINTISLEDALEDAMDVVNASASTNETSTTISGSGSNTTANDNNVQKDYLKQQVG